MIARTRGCTAALQQRSAQLQDGMTSVKYGNTHICISMVSIAKGHTAGSVDMTYTGRGRDGYSSESGHGSALYLGVDSSSNTGIQYGHSHAED